MRKFIAKFRHCLTILIIALTVSNLTISPSQNPTSNANISTNGIWIVETE